MNNNASIEIPCNFVVVSSDNLKLSRRKKITLQAKQAKFARLLKSDIPNKLRNIQGFTFHK